ncbi:MAG TPA: DNA gyrase C-terminal beta-propeller domain-containing protein, partial [Dehalococcoidia bacterium]|nr:DNA gyrase C-terminal beta-propeller domain-containing protein [Dehalococcoidia bacterium]
DAVRHLLVTDTHDKLIFFTDRGRCFQVRAYELPDESRQARGTPLINLISLDQRERITAVVRCPPEMEHDFMLMATRMGEVKKTPLRNFAAVRRDGLIAMDLEPADEFVAAKLVSDEDQVILVTARGQSLRFAVKTLRSASRLSGGVRGVKLAAGDSVVGMDVVRPGEALLVVSALGHGKRTPFEDYPLHGRGGQGVITFKTHPKSGPLIAARVVDPTHELMLISVEGIVLRTPVAHISLQGRPTQGVRLMDVGGGDAVAAVAVIDMQRGFTEPQALPTGATVKTREPQKKGKRGKPAAKASGAAKTKGAARPARPPTQPRPQRPTDGGERRKS